MLFFKKKDYKTAVIKVFGMKCGMCETHINDIVRKNFDIKSVKASHSKNEVTIKYLGDLDLEQVKRKIEETGYDCDYPKKRN